MNWLKTGTVWVMLAVWLPITNHCRLEQLPGLNFLACCDQNCGSSEESDCQTDGCELLENGFYKSENTPIKVIPPAVSAAAFLALALELDMPEEQFRLEFQDRAPPQIPAGWQFSLRAAGLPRAPAI